MKPIEILIHSQQPLPQTTRGCTILPLGYLYRPYPENTLLTTATIIFDLESFADKILYSSASPGDLADASWDICLTLALGRLAYPGRAIGFYNIPGINWNQSDYRLWHARYNQIMSKGAIACPACYLPHGYSPADVLPGVVSSVKRGWSTLPIISPLREESANDLIPDTVQFELYRGLMNLGITQFALWDGYNNAPLRHTVDILIQVSRLYNP